MDSNDIDVAGVAFITSFFATNFGWIVRNRQPIDVGIDADVEQKKDGRYTGKHIALQIKSGESYQKVNKSGNFSFIIDDWHYKYWFASDRPVLLLFYNPKNKQIIWEQVKKVNVASTKKNHKIEICPKKILKKESLSELEDILNNFTPVNSEIIDINILTYDYAYYCYREANHSALDVVNGFKNFVDEIQRQIISPNPKILENVFITYQRRFAIASELFIQKFLQVCHYINILTKNENSLEIKSLLNRMIEIIESNIKIWDTNKLALRKINHPNFPFSVKRAGNNYISIIEDYIYDLKSTNSFLISIKTRLL